MLHRSSRVTSVVNYALNENPEGTKQKDFKKHIEFVPAGRPGVKGALLPPPSFPDPPNPQAPVPGPSSPKPQNPGSPKPKPKHAAGAGKKATRKTGAARYADGLSAVKRV
jgi:hypothetical protein